MSIFEDLIEELKEENLLEETVIEVHKEKTSPVKLQAGVTAFENSPQQNVTAPFDFQPIEKSLASGKPTPFELPKLATEDEEIYAAEDFLVSSEPITSENSDFVEPITSGEDDTAEFTLYPEVEKPKILVSEKEYFRKRAMDEVSGLQMVDHVLSGIEREQMKIVPKSYDDLPVKLSLHDFLQDSHEVNSTEYAQAEFKLMQETENWYSALSLRDKQITVAHLRRYCETTRPALSSQALIALARFYRNSPYTEQVRSKFELVATRLFSREDENDKRELLLSRAEIMQQLKELYADWSSIQLYSANEEDSEIVILMMKFDDFVAEAESTENFELLIGNDFFNRLRMLKEECRDNFFAPSIVVSAILANVKIGNRYLDLLKKEKEKFSAETLEEKYGFIYDQAVSDATGKTFQLVELLHEKSKNVKASPAETVEISVKSNHKNPLPKISKKPRNKFYSVNKWLLAAAVLLIGGCLALYFWAESQSTEVKSSVSVKKVNLDNSDFKDYIKTARIAEETFYGITTDAWESINSQKKEELMNKLQKVGLEKNYKIVQLINSDGKTVGFASAEKTEIYNQ